MKAAYRWQLNDDNSYIYITSTTNNEPFISSGISTNDKEISLYVSSLNETEYSSAYSKMYLLLKNCSEFDDYFLPVSYKPYWDINVDSCIDLQGAAATIKVGKVTTLSPGTNAFVENVGTKENAIFNFGIPQGEQGISGSGTTTTSGTSGVLVTAYNNNTNVATYPISSQSAFTTDSNGWYTSDYLASDGAKPVSTTPKLMSYRYIGSGAEKWSVPVKVEESFGVKYPSAITISDNVVSLYRESSNSGLSTNTTEINNNFYLPVLPTGRISLSNDKQPSGNTYWSKTMPNSTTGYIYQATCLRNVYADNTVSYDAWNLPPLRLNGVNGKPGEDIKGDNGLNGDQIEYIYKRTVGKTTTSRPNVPNVNSVWDNGAIVISSSEFQTDDFIGPSAYTETTTYGVPYNQKTDWSDNPIGVDETNVCEWISMRTKKFSEENPNGVWGSFSPAVQWSVWSEDGKDGDGLEYIYSYSNTLDNNVKKYFTDTNGTPIVPTFDISGDTTYQNSDEFVETISTYGYSDNPKGVNNTNPTEYVSVRRRRNGLWGYFSFPSLWAKYATDGVDGAGVEYIYTRKSSKATNAEIKQWYYPQITEPNYQNDKYTGLSGKTTTWTDNPQGINTSLPYEYVSVRSLNRETGKWEAFAYATLWSAYGEQGKDGDGIEYVFTNTNSPIFSANETIVDPSSISINSEGFQNDEYIPYGWFDDPQNVSVEKPYTWVSIRKGTSNNWKAFSTPSKWTIPSAPTYVINLDNDTTSVACDENGAPIASTISISVGATMYKNNELCSDGGSITAVPKNCSGTTRIDMYGITYTINKIDSSKDNVNVVFNYQENGKTLANATFTIIKIKKGDDGINPIIYEINPSANVIKEESNGTATPLSVSANVTKYDGGTITSITDTLPSPLRMTYSKDGGVENTYTLGTGIANISTGITFALYNNNSLIDKEVIPVLKNGTNGTNGKDGTDYEFIFTRTNSATPIPTTPSTSQTDDYVPSGWTDDSQGVSSTHPYEWVSKRSKKENVWSNFSIPSIWSKYGEDGKDGINGCIVRTTEWASGIEYRNDNGIDINTLPNKLGYIDVVTVTQGNATTLYTCISGHTSSGSTFPYDKVKTNTNTNTNASTALWEKVSSTTPIYTPLLLAANAVVNIMQGNKILIQDTNGNIVGGLIGGNMYPFFLGGSDASVSNFKIDSNGIITCNGGQMNNIVVTDANIMGTLTQSVAKYNWTKDDVTWSSFKTVTNDYNIIKMPGCSTDSIECNIIIEKPETDADEFFKPNRRYTLMNIPYTENSIRYGAYTKDTIELKKTVISETISQIWGSWIENGSVTQTTSINAYEIIDFIVVKDNGIYQFIITNRTIAPEATSDSIVLILTPSVTTDVSKPNIRTINLSLKNNSDVYYSAPTNLDIEWNYTTQIPSENLTLITNGISQIPENHNTISEEIPKFYVNIIITGDTQGWTAKLYINNQLSLNTDKKIEINIQYYVINDEDGREFGGSTSLYIEKGSNSGYTSNGLAYNESVTGEIFGILTKYYTDTNSKKYAIGLNGQPSGGDIIGDISFTKVSPSSYYDGSHLYQIVLNND